MKKLLYSLLILGLLCSCNNNSKSSSNLLDESSSNKINSSINYVSFFESSSSVADVLSSSIEESSLLINSSSISGESSIISSVSQDNTSSIIESSSVEEVSSSSVESSSSEISSSSSVAITYTLKGQIVDTNNIGLSGIEVKLMSNDIEIKSAVTNNEGEFEFTYLEEGIYRLSFLVNDSTYEIQGSHGEFAISGYIKEFTYPTIIVKKNNISWGELS